jgi:hypothetical protein
MALFSVAHEWRDNISLANDMNTPTGPELSYVHPKES